MEIPPASPVAQKYLQVGSSPSATADDIETLTMELEGALLRPSRAPRNAGMRGAAEPSSVRTAPAVGSHQRKGRAAGESQGDGRGSLQRRAAGAPAPACTSPRLPLECTTPILSHGRRGCSGIQNVPVLSVRLPAQLPELSLLAARWLRTTPDHAIPGPAPPESCLEALNKAPSPPPPRNPPHLAQWLGRPCGR
jgi:hypothetical protein